MINIVDLFSGVGGLTFGFYYKIKKNNFVRNKEFNFLFANEYNSCASKAFRLNFPNIPLFECDIADITKNFLLNNEIEIENVDLVIGGPPCQSFSTVGKRQYDQRAKMYKEYIRLLGILKPKMFIFENVTGLLSMKNDKQSPVINDIYKMFDNINGDGTLGYRIEKQVLNAKKYGVPQSRERVFLIGINKNYDIPWSFPKPTHGESESLKNYLTIKDAIEDLPPLNNGEEVKNYIGDAKSDYAKLMRSKSKELNDHFSGTHGEKMLAIIKAVPQGEGKNYINLLVKQGLLEKEYYLTSGYGNTYGRLWWDKPSTTITNSLGSPSSLRCIHPLQNRALSTREGARLQSFPDWFKFIGGKAQKNTQVGNAVPPLLAIHLAKSVKKSIKI